MTQLVSAKLAMSMTCSRTSFAPNAAATDRAHSKSFACLIRKVCRHKDSRNPWQVGSWLILGAHV